MSNSKKEQCACGLKYPKLTKHTRNVCYWELPSAENSLHLPIIYIQWDDAVTHSGWWTQEQAIVLRNQQCISHEVGFLVSENETAIVLAKAKAGDWRDVSRILKANIIKRIELK